SWIHREDTDAWQKAERLPELKRFFQPGISSPAAARALGALDETSMKPRPGALRRIKLLAGLTDAKLDRFAQFPAIHPVPHWSEIVKQGSTGDSMYLVLEG